MLDIFYHCIATVFIWNVKSPTLLVTGVRYADFAVQINIFDKICLFKEYNNDGYLKDLQIFFHNAHFYTSGTFKIMTFRASSYQLHKQYFFKNQ